MIFWRCERKTFYTNNNDLCKTNLDRHEAGLKIPGTDISVLNGSLWKVKSQTSDQYYNVFKTAELCSYDHCYNKCLTITCNGFYHEDYANISIHVIVLISIECVITFIKSIHTLTGHLSSNIAVIAVYLTLFLILRKHH